jgi:hypothetical protein
MTNEYLPNPTSHLTSMSFKENAKNVLTIFLDNILTK